MALVACDRTYRLAQAQGVAAPMWLGKCIHCRSALSVGQAGQVSAQVTIEHIVPKAAGGADVPENLALACARCNHQKGTRLDARGMADPRLAHMVEVLQKERLKRLRKPPEHMGLSPAAHAWLAGAGEANS